MRYDDPRYAKLELWKRRLDRSWCPQKIPYFISDFYRLDPDLGYEQELKALVDDAHRLGMRVLLDLVMQGCAENNDLVARHPEWFVRTLDGDVSTSHGWDYYGPNLSLDWAVPAVQTYFHDLTVHHVTAYDVDGFRVDAASWKESNCQADAERLPSATQFGGHHTLKAVRKAVKAAKHDAGFVLLGDVPLIYSGQELAHADLLRGLLALRKSSPPLLCGSRLWRRPQSPSQDVLTCIRRLDGEAAVVVINVAPESIPATLEVEARDLGDESADWSIDPVWPGGKAAMQGTIEGTTIEIELPPYSTHVLVVGHMGRSNP